MTFYNWLKKYYETYYKKAEEIHDKYREYLLNRPLEPVCPEDEEYTIDWADDWEDEFIQIENEGIDETIFAVWERIKNCKGFPKRSNNIEQILEAVEYGETPDYLSCPTSWVMDAFDKYEKENLAKHKQD